MPVIPIVIPIQYLLWVSLESLQYRGLLLHQASGIHDIGLPTADVLDCLAPCWSPSPCPGLLNHCGSVASRLPISDGAVPM